PLACAEEREGAGRVERGDAAEDLGGGAQERRLPVLVGPATERVVAAVERGPHVERERGLPRREAVRLHFGGERFEDRPGHGGPPAPRAQRGEVEPAAEAVAPGGVGAVAERGDGGVEVALR